MGAWGIKPYENDGAADWFGDLWDRCQLPEKVGATLLLDARKHHEKVRAAAHILIQLGETSIWPVASLDRHCELAAGQLELIKAMEIYDAEEFQTVLQNEIDALRSRTSEKFRRAQD